MACRVPKKNLRTRRQYGKYALVELAELNQHPLNQAALVRLQQLHLPHDPKSIHLLTLASAGHPNDRQKLELHHWNRSLRNQYYALAHLSGHLTPEQVRQLHPSQVLALVSRHLQDKFRE